VAALVLLLAPACGCAAWNGERWSLNSLRDERVGEIEQRLSRDKPIVENPFQKAESESD